MLTSKSASDPETLLTAANSASEKVAALHIAFLALCTYVLVIAFSTTDRDLLIGKGIKLPVVDVEVPITGFYATVPYLLVITHFNLLLQLQLLSRRLFAFEEAAPKGEAIGGLHDRLHIFTYNYYLVGHPNRLIYGLVALLVTSTILLLPLLALLLLQAHFLAYQNVGITWLQRVAIWLDVILVTMLWPVIMHRRDSWKGYMKEARQCARLPWKGLVGAILGYTMLVLPIETEVVMASHALPTREATVVQFLLLVLAVWLWLTLLALLVRDGMRWFHFGVKHDAAPPILGLRGFLTVAVLGWPLPLLLTVDGEFLDRPQARGTTLLELWRHLDLHEQFLLATSAKPEIRTDLPSEEPDKWKSTLRTIDGVDLQKRNLRHADLRGAVLAKADLREADLTDAHLEGALLRGARLKDVDLTNVHLKGTDLQGADLAHAVLDGAVLRGAYLNGVNLANVHLKGADLSGADLTGADLQNADLTGTTLDRADLMGVHLQGTNLNKVRLWNSPLKHLNLQGADLTKASMQMAPLVFADLQGANLTKADLRGANLTEARLEGANLQSADLRGAVLVGVRLDGADLSNARLEGADLEDAHFRGAVLVSGRFYNKSWKFVDSPLVDARGLQWQPLSTIDVEQLLKEASDWKWSRQESRLEFERFQAAIIAAAKPKITPPQIDSCLSDNKSQLRCKTTYSLEEFRKALHPEITRLVCQSRDIARGILRRLNYNDSDRQEFVMAQDKRKQETNTCPGVTLLDEEDWKLIRGVKITLTDDIDF